MFSLFASFTNDLMPNLSKFLTFTIAFFAKITKILIELCKHHRNALKLDHPVCAKIPLIIIYNTRFVNAPILISTLCEQPTNRTIDNEKLIGDFTDLQLGFLAPLWRLAITPPRGILRPP